MLLSKLALKTVLTRCTKFKPVVFYCDKKGSDKPKVPLPIVEEAKEELVPIAPKVIAKNPPIEQLTHGRIYDPVTDTYQVSKVPPKKPTVMDHIRDITRPERLPPLPIMGNSEEEDEPLELRLSTVKTGEEDSGSGDAGTGKDKTSKAQTAPGQGTGESPSHQGTPDSSPRQGSGVSSPPQGTGLSSPSQGTSVSHPGQGTGAQESAQSPSTTLGTPREPEKAPTPPLGAPQGPAQAPSPQRSPQSPQGAPQTTGVSPPSPGPQGNAQSPPTTQGTPQVTSKASITSLGTPQGTAQAPSPPQGTPQETTPSSPPLGPPQTPLPPLKPQTTAQPVVPNKQMTQLTDTMSQSVANTQSLPSSTTTSGPEGTSSPPPSSTPPGGPINANPPPDGTDLPTPPRLERPEPARVMFCLIPYSWVKDFNKKTGITGFWTFLFTYSTYLISKEKLVMEHEYYGGLSMALLATLSVIYVGPSIAESLDKQIDAFEASFQQQRINDRETIEDNIKEEEWAQTSMTEQLAVVQAKREMIDLQLEAEFRQRQMNVYKQVKNILDYQVAYEQVERRFAQENMVRWVMKEVLASINDQIDAQYVDKCLVDLDSLSRKQQVN